MIGTYYRNIISVYVNWTQNLPNGRREDIAAYYGHALVGCPRQRAALVYRWHVGGTWARWGCLGKAVPG